MTGMRRPGETPTGLKISDFQDKSLLIVDDDDPLRDRLSRAMEKKGFQVTSAKPLKMLLKWCDHHLQNLL